MKWFLGLCAAILFSLFLAGLAGANPPPQPPAKKKFARGARRSPQHKILAAPRFQRLKAPPAQVAYVPAKLDMWGNDTYGDCVTAEEAFAKACFQPEIFLDPAVVVAWAQARGYRDGADLSSVLQSMQSDGFVVGQQKYDDGSPATVDYTSEAILQAAVAQGPVKIAIDANALPSGAGNQQGWYAFGGSPGQFPNTDHCVSVAGYGPTAWLAQQLGVAVPPGAPASGYLVYTWSTIGIVDFAWLQSTTVEAWVRNPTTVGVPPLTPTPPPGPGPGPSPGVPTLVGIMATFSDGSTQTLGSAPAPTGLTPAQLKAMTGQQIADFINSAGKAKPKPPAPAPVPPKPTPPPMPPAKPVSEVSPIVAALEGLEKRLTDRIDKRLDSIENRVRQLETNKLEVKRSTPLTISQANRKRGILDYTRSRYPNLSGDALLRKAAEIELDMDRLAEEQKQATSPADSKPSAKYLEDQRRLQPVSRVDTDGVNGLADKWKDRRAFKTNQGKGVMRSDSIDKRRVVESSSVAQGTADNQESYADAYRRALREGKPLIVWVGGNFCPT